MKGVYIRFALAFIFGLSAYFLISKHEASVSIEDLAKYKSFCENSVETSAVLSDSYTERKVKVITFYTFDYTYKVDEAAYSGRATFTDLPESPVVPIWYDKTNPAFSEEDNPCKRYEEIKDKPIDENNDKYLMFGLGSALLAFFLLISAVSKAGRIHFKVDN